MDKRAGSISRMLFRAGRLTPEMVERLTKARVLPEHYVTNPNAVRTLNEAYRLGDVSLGRSSPGLPERIRKSLHNRIGLAVKRKPMYRPIASGLESGATEVAPGIAMKVGPKPGQREFDLPMLMKETEHGSRPVFASLLEGNTPQDVLRNPNTGDPVMAYLQEKVRPGPMGAESTIDQRISSGVTLSKFFPFARNLERQGWKIVDAPVEGGLRQFGTTGTGELKLLDSGAVVGAGEYTPLVQAPSPVAQIRQLLADPTFRQDLKQSGYRDLHKLMSDSLEFMSEHDSFFGSPLKRQSYRTRPVVPLV